MLIDPVSPLLGLMGPNSAGDNGGPRPGARTSLVPIDLDWPGLTLICSDLSRIALNLNVNS